MPHAELVQMFVGHCSAHDGGLDLSLCPTSYLSQFPKPGSLESSLWGSQLALTLLLICVSCVSWRTHNAFSKPAAWAGGAPAREIRLSPGLPWPCWVRAPQGPEDAEYRCLPPQ